MSGTTTAIGAPSAPCRRGRRLRPRHLWLVPGLAIAIFANELGKGTASGSWRSSPSGSPRTCRGCSGRRGRPAHNLLHQPMLAGAAVAIAAVASAVSILPAAWLVGSLVWLGHVIAGRGVGDVPRRGGDRPHA